MENTQYIKIPVQEYNRLLICKHELHLILSSTNKIVQLDKGLTNLIRHKHGYPVPPEV